MRRVLCLVLLSACGDAMDPPLRVSLQMPQQASDVKSIEIFVIRAETLGRTGAEACDAFFKDTLGSFRSAASATISVSGAAQESDLKVPAGKGYVVFATAWDVDLNVTPDAPKKALALGCAHQNVNITANLSTRLELKMCLLRPDGEVCPAR